MASNNTEGKWENIQLAAKVIGHISQGMYRTPAGAIKELISNAYDAGATRVKIHTGFPVFAEFTCEDNGSGILEKEFLRLMNGGIGDSTKQQSLDAEETGKNERPIIGRLGVGMLSLAQICSRFTLVSHHGASKTAFTATIKFPPYTRHEIDKVQAELEASGKKYVKSGEFHLETIPYVESQRGLKVTTTHLREAFRRTMSDLGKLAYLTSKKRKQTYPRFDDFISAITSKTMSSLFFASPYDRLVYGLALASPLPYVESKDAAGLAPVLLKVPEIRKLQDLLLSYDFQVEVDNMSIRRPLMLPSNKNGTTAAECEVPELAKTSTFELKDGAHTENVAIKEYAIRVRGKPEKFHLYHFDYEAKVNGRTLHFSGYIFMQTSRLFPKEFQGVLVRLRHVAISEYDVNVMTYPQAEGPRFSMLSSEVFVHRGLDDALKVDRDGFNTLDPHYIRLQSFLHSILHEKIFPGSWDEEKKRNKRKRLDESRAKSRSFQTRLKQVTSGSFTTVEVVNNDAAPEEDIVSVDEKSRSIQINEGHPTAKSLLGGKGKNHELARQILIAFEVANRGKTEEKRREVFHRLIEDLFNG